MINETDLLRPDTEWLGGSEWGTEHQLETLLRWCAANPAPFALHTILARAGAGKTRFAVELIRRLVHADASWRTGWIRPGTGHPEWDPSRPALWIADGAAALVPQLHNLASRVLADPHARPVRVLALERRGDELSGWLYRLLGDPWTRDGLAPFANEVPSTVVTPGPLLRKRLFEHVLAACVARMGIEPPLFDPALFEGRPKRDEWINPGYLVLAAIESCHHPPAEVFRKSGKELATAIAGRAGGGGPGLIGDAWLAANPTCCADAGLYSVLHAWLEFDGNTAIQTWVRGQLSSLEADELEMADGMLDAGKTCMRDAAVETALRLYGVAAGSPSGSVTQARRFSTVSRRLSVLGRDDEALAAADRALPEARHSADDTLVSALIWRASLGGPERLALASEAVEVCRRHSESSETAWADRLARALSHLGDAYASESKWSEAHDSYLDCIRIIAARFPNVPNRVMNLLSATLDDYRLACRKSAQGEATRLLDPIEEFFRR